MARLPSELLSEVFLLACAERTHNIEQKLHLAQVCTYWRAVALGYPSFWAQIRVHTSRDAALLSIALARAGDSALYVELLWLHNRFTRSLSDAEEQAVVDALMATKQRLRMKRLFVTPAAPVLLSALLGAGSKFPALEDLEFDENFEYSAPDADRLDAPYLRRLILSRLCLESFHFLDTPSLEHLSLGHPPYYETDKVLTTILYQCTALRRLDWDAPAADFTPTISEAMQGPLAARLNTLRLGVSVPSSDILRFINRAAVDPLPEIAVTIENGEADHELFVELLSRVGVLVDLRHDDIREEVVIRDDVGRIRRLVGFNSFNNNYVLYMKDLWIILARLNAIDSLHSLRVRTNEWHGLAGGFATRAPIALTEIQIVLRGGIRGTPLDLNNEGETFEDFLPPRILNVPSLRRLVIVKDRASAHYEERRGDDDPCRVPTITRMREILRHIECEASSRVQVCVSAPELFEGRTLPRATQETLLDGFTDKWALCSHCTGTGT